MWGLIVQHPDALKGDVRAFYEIAATLIPLLLFGGIVAERVIPPKGRWKPFHLAAVWGIPWAGLMAVVAEVLAIDALVSGEADVVTRYMVSAVLVGGMLAVVFAISLPWQKGMREELGKPLSRLLRLGVAVMVAGVSFGALIGLASAVDVAGGTERTKAYEAAIQKNIDEEEVVQERIRREIARQKSLGEEVSQAEELHEGPRFLALMIAQERLDQLVALDFKEEQRLVLESANLYRELEGLPTLKHVIFKHPQPHIGQKRPSGDSASGRTG